MKKKAFWGLLVWTLFFAPHSNSFSAQFKTINQYQLVFVGGFTNEIIPGYFRDNIATAKDEFGAKDITVLHPSSGRSTIYNALWLAQKFIQIYEKNNHRPLIVIGHSKGAVESFMAAFVNDEVLLKVVAKFYFVQGPFEGTPLANLAVAACQKNELIDHWFRFCGEGIESLTSEQAQKNMTEVVAGITPLQAEVSRRKMVLVQASQDEAHVIKAFQKTHRYLDALEGENDGLVALRDQEVMGFPLRKMIFDGDHSDLMSNSLLSNASTESRHEFTRIILEDALTTY